VAAPQAKVRGVDFEVDHVRDVNWLASRDESFSIRLLGGKVDTRTMRGGANWRVTFNVAKLLRRGSADHPGDRRFGAQAVSNTYDVWGQRGSKRGGREPARPLFDDCQARAGRARPRESPLPSCNTAGYRQPARGE
jgi:hypothetical protein